MRKSSEVAAAIEGRLPEIIREKYIRKFLVIAIIVAILMLSLGVYTQLTVSAEIAEDRDKQLLASTELAADNVEQWLAQKEREVTSLSKEPAFESGSTLDTINSTLQRGTVTGDDDLVSIHHIDTSDEVILQSTEKELANTPLGDRNLRWKETSRGYGLSGTDRDTAGSNEIYRVNGQPRIAFMSLTGKINRAVVTVYDLRARSEQFRDVVEGGETSVVSAETGTVMFSSNESKTLEPYVDDRNATVLQRGANGTSDVLDRGNELVMYAPIEETEWIVVKHVPKANAYALKNTVQNDLIVLIGASLLGLGVLATFVGRDIIPRITAVSEGASEIAKGNLDVTIADEGRSDEIGQVRNAFRDTNDYLQTVAAQADALARGDFEDPALEEDVPGELGESLETMREDLQESIEEIEAARERAQASREEAEAMAQSLQRQADEFSTVMAEAADGDLTRRLNEDVDNEAMAEVATAANEMLAQLQTTLEDVQAFAEDVDASAEDVAASANEVQRVSEDVSESVQEIAEGADRQDGTVKNASEELTDLSAAIEEVASSAEEVAQKSQRAADLGETGSEYGADALAEMDAVESQAETTIEEVERLESAMDEIGDIAGLIDEIADQTNMLALNASIEAARAGEAGEGFAVVADEIKQLAQETSDATGDIEARIAEVQDTTEHVVEDMYDVGDSVTEGIDAVEDAVSVLEDLVEQVEEANTGIQSINDATDDQAASTEEVVAMMDEVGSISEQTAREAESVSAAAEEQTASITEVSEQIQSLSDRSGELRDAVSQFQLTEQESYPGTDKPGNPDAAADGGRQD